MKIILLALYDVNSFAVRILHRTLADAGYDVESVFFKKMQTNQYHTPKETDLLLDFLKAREPDLIGLSIRSSFFQLACNITRSIKANLKATVIWGGTHPTISPKESVQIADAVCIGEGEDALIEFAGCLKRGERPNVINNIWINDGKKITRNPVRTPVDVNKVAFPDWDNRNKYFIDNNAILENCNAELNIYKDKYYPIMASRGCFYSCTFCCNNIYKRIYPQNYIRKRTVNNVIEELALARSAYPHLERVVFSDDMMVNDEIWVREFCAEYKKKILLPFNCQFIPAYVKEPAISALKDAGMSTVTMGIQSGSERVRTEIFKRNYTNELVLKNAKLFRNYGLDANYDLILDNPFETPEETKMTLELLLKIPTPYRLRMYSLIYFPATELTQRALSEGVISEQDVEDNRQKALTEWRVNLDSKVKCEESIFFNNLIAMTGISFIPRNFIRFLSNSSIIKKHKGLLIYIGGLLRALERLKMGWDCIFVKRDFVKIAKHFSIR